MADEVPVCDVLCEAMEYLSKLGSNLRARSENLREKRIRKDKLKNYHAVQKAADKVLLICQLSKKSLENVECGVRKVLTLLSAGQQNSSVGSDAATPSASTQEEIEYRHFKYRSYKLKISRKVPVKHYMSVRVLARNMSLSMHDKYPVYHNCKLYRARKRKERAIKSDDESESVVKKDPDEIKEQKTEDSNISTEVTKSNKRKKSIENCNKDNEVLPDIQMNSQLGTFNEASQNNVKKSSSHNVIQSTEKKDSVLIGNLKSNKIRRPNEKSDDENLIKHRDSKSNYRKIQVIDDDSSDSNHDVNNEKSEHIDTKVRDNESVKSLDKSKTNEKNKNSLDDCDSSSEVKKSKEVDINESGVEKVNNIEIVKENNNTDNETNEQPIKPLIKCVNINKLLKPDIVMNKKESPTKKNQAKKKNLDSDEDSINKENIKQRNKKTKKHSVDEDYWVQKRKEVSAFVSKKFLIKLVRLPELSEDFLNLYSLKRIVHNNKIICVLGNDKKSNNIEKSVDESEKTSPNPIDVVKNALLHDSDSEKSDLSGSKSPLPLAEIEETVKNVLNSDVTSTEKVARSPFSELEETVKKVLIESLNAENESNADENTRQNNTDVFKNSLLNDSVSDIETDVKNNDNQGSEVNKQKDMDLKKKLLAESDSEMIENSESGGVNKDAASSKNVEEKVDETSTKKTKNKEEHSKKELATKDTEANKSDDDNSITPKKKKKHKRKMMESIHAKKMLLTYSSSSDTEDEQLRNALKEIKDSLLKGMSSSDDEKKSKLMAKKSSSSEDEGILKTRRKRQKSRTESTSESAEQCDQHKKNENSSENNKREDSDHSSSLSSRMSGKNSKSSSKKVRFE